MASFRLLFWYYFSLFGSDRLVVCCSSCVVVFFGLVVVPPCCVLSCLCLVNACGASSRVVRYSLPSSSMVFFHSCDVFSFFFARCSCLVFTRKENSNTMKPRRVLFVCGYLFNFLGLSSLSRWCWRGFPSCWYEDPVLSFLCWRFFSFSPR